MKKILSVFLILLLFTISVSAHSGGTDANGGHYNRSTGEYHYHHGYPAHQHVNGVCPYDYDDQTEHRSTTNSSSSSSGNDSSSSKSSTAPTASSPPKVSHSSTSNTAEKSGALSSLETSVTSAASSTLLSQYWWIAIIFVCLLLLKAYRTACRENKELDCKNKDLTRKNAEEAARHEKTQQLLHSVLDGKCLSELSPSPHPSVYVNSNGLPCGPGSGPWGTGYTVYLTSLKSPVFHCRPFCSTSYGLPTNIVLVGSRRPCSKCYQTAPPDLRWYYKQREILKLCHECGIELPPDPSDPDEP